jgi:hypothetical protein
MEPEILRRGKAFHKRVQGDWENTAKGGKINIEHSIPLSILRKKTMPQKTGRLDIFVDELGDFISVVEIKSTDWDKVKEKNRKKLLGSHRRQVWRYIEEYVDIKKIDVCPGIIYPKSPITPGLKDLIEDYLNDYGLQVVWYDDPE